MEVCCGYKVTCIIAMTMDGNSRRRLTVRLNQHLTVLSKHILACILNPASIIVFRLRTRNICLMSFLVSIIIALPFVIVAFTVLNTDIELTIFLIGAIHITDITATEDVTILAFQLLRRTYRTSVHLHLCLSEDVTVGIECTTFTEVVIASTTTEDITLYQAFEEFYIRLTCLVDACQGTNAVVNARHLDDTTSYSSNLTTTEEGVTYYAAIHLDISDIYTTVVDIATTEDTSTIVQGVQFSFLLRLVINLLLVII